MEWETICDYNVCGAYDFLTAEDIAFLLKDCKEKPTPTGEFDIVDFLLEAYGSDADVIQTVIEKKYPNGEYFWLCDLIEDNKRQEDYFHVRVWRLKVKKSILGSEDIKRGEDEEHGILKGNNIGRFYTIGNMYNNGCIGVESGKKYFRFPLTLSQL